MFSVFIDENYDNMLNTLKKLCSIPAPSGMEQNRAEYIKEILLSFGADNVIIDEAYNAIFSLNCENSNEISVIAAHTDTVFSDLDELCVIEKDGKFYCPGVGDDTASVVVLLYTVKYFLKHNIKPKNGVMFVFNSCEEGLGNLKGTKQLFKTYGDRIKEFISLDNSDLNGCYNECVGSHRYKLTVNTQGGHSFERFGNTNAIYELSKVINKIYEIEVPKREGSVTTYNVGIISGGTSVNTIPQKAEMLCEYRSNNSECLEIMKNRFKVIFDGIKSEGVTADIELIGDRPCGTSEMKDKSKYLCEILEKIVARVVDKDVRYEIGSTDSNVPISLGVPAITFGVFEGACCHTLDEYIVPESLKKGLEISLEFCKTLLGE